MPFIADAINTPMQSPEAAETPTTESVDAMIERKINEVAVKMSHANYTQAGCVPYAPPPGENRRQMLYTIQELDNARQSLQRLGFDDLSAIVSEAVEACMRAWFDLRT